MIHKQIKKSFWDSDEILKNRKNCVFQKMIQKCFSATNTFPPDTDSLCLMYVYVQLTTAQQKM